MKLKHSRIAWLVILLVLVSGYTLVFAATEPVQKPGQVQPGEAPQKGAESGWLQSFDLLSEQDGWLLANGGLYWTADAGQTWEDITPPQTGAAGIQNAYFLDARLGWAALSESTESGEALYWVARTTDRGATWQMLPAALFEPGDPDAISEALFLQFLDANTGWLVTRRATSSNFRVGALFKTHDGGESWSRLALPIGEPVSFVTAEKGWVAGGAAGEELYETVDGGSSWQRKEVGQGGQKRLYRLPVFKDERAGILPVIIKEGLETQVDFYETADGGATWQLSSGAQVEREVNSGNEIPFAALKSEQWVIVDPQERQALHSLAGGQVERQPSAGPGVGFIDQIDMVSAEVGWAVSESGSCSGELGFAAEPEQAGQVDIACTQTLSLLRTVDGGATWQSLALPGVGAVAAQAYKSELYAGQGFDSCSMPSAALMQDWITNSPYRVWNLYIGGSSRAGCGTLTSAYISQLASQGWKFIPTWVGPQAACTNFTTRMSYDPATAYAQGVAEANQAVDAAAALGLTNPDKTGAILYYDLESYNTTDASCRAAAKSFISGWVTRLHALGNQAGVYGSPCSSAISDFDSNPQPPDAVWLAAWMIPYQYRQNVSLTNLACISSSLWSNHQRLRQYSGSHRESWGGFSLGSLDSNVIDAPVVELGRNTACPQSGGVTLYWNTHYSCANNSGDAGYRQRRTAGFQNVSDGQFNDKASSLRVPTGWSVLLYENNERGGRKICFNHDVPDLSAEGNFSGSNVPINDNVSSMEVFDNAGCSSSPPPEPAPGYWNVTYYNGTGFETQCSVTTASGPLLFKDWGSAAPASNCNADRWSARFQRTVHFGAGSYTFLLGSDDWARIKIGEEVVVNNWQGAGQHSTTRTLSAGDYSVTVEYADVTGNARVAAWWTGPGFESPRQARDPNQWYAQYWGNKAQWWDAIVQVNEGSGKLSHLWGFDGPGYGLPSDAFSARFERQVSFDCGEYVFYIEADDGVRFSIDGQVWLERWVDQAAKFNVPVTLSAGSHELRVDYYDNTQVATLSLDWEKKSGCASPTPTRTATRTATATPTRTPTHIPGELIFADSFEAGDLSAWSSGVIDGGDLSVNPAAAMDGALGMRALINDNRSIFVSDATPLNESAYRVAFFFDPNSIRMIGGNAFTIFNATNSAGKVVFNLVMRRYSGQYQLRAGVTSNNFSWRYTGWYAISDAPHLVEIDWKASQPDMGNGSLKLSLDGVLRGSVDKIANAALRVETVRLGAVASVDSGTRGSIYFDGFSSWRGSSPGGAVPPTPTASGTAKPPPTATRTPPPTVTRTPPPVSSPTATRTTGPSPTASRPDAIFSDGFEAGNFSAWTTYVHDGGDLSVSANGAMKGARAMRALIDDNTSIYVIDDRPAAEARYRARFYFHPNSIRMANGDSFTIHNASDAGAKTLYKVDLRLDASIYQLRAGVNSSSGVWTYSDWYNIGNKPHTIEVEWRAGDAGQSNGILALWIDQALLGNLTGIANSGQRIERVRLGAAYGVDSGTRGVLYFDDFVSRRNSYIGP